MNLQNIVIIFTKNLVAGKVKTRLAASVGTTVAFDVCKALTQHTHAVAKKINAAKIVYYSDQLEENDEWGNEFLKAVQQGKDLGERMKNAFIKMFGQGYQKAVIIGTDCPALKKSIVANAFKKLDEADVVIGPAFDGGYYLLGLKQPYPFLFDNMQWSTSNVLSHTMDRCKTNNVMFLLLQQLHDVDEEKDLVHLKKLLYK